MILKYLTDNGLRQTRLRRLRAALGLSAILMVLTLPGYSQSFLLRYVNTTSGGITFSGNTLGLAKLTGANQPGTLDSIGTFITLNTNSQVGNYPPGTTLNWSNNSSAAVLQMPTNSTVLYAELVWAGTSQIAADTSPAGSVTAYLNNPVTFTLPGGATNLISPDPVTGSLVTNGTEAIFYVRSANVTALVQAGGAGIYAAGGVPGTVLASEDNNNACGWTLAVVYGNESLPSRNLSLFVGNSFAIASGNPPSPASVSGFCVPPLGTVSARLYVSAVEGDPNKTGDQMKFGPSPASLTALSGPNNLVGNFFASQINDDNGLLDTNGTFGLSNSVPPTVGFSARQGWDITSVDLSGILTNGMTSAYAQNVTAGDGYSVNVLALQINAGAPVLNTTQSVDKASTFVGDTLTYTVVVTNSGTADAVDLIFTDPLPFGTSFITNTFATNGVTVPGANPVNGVPVPIIKQNSSFTFTYRVLVNQIPPSAMFVTAATITFEYSGACAQSPIINATLVNANVQTLVPLLSVNKQASLTNVIPGANLTYTINVPNTGTTNTIGSTLVDPIPAGVSYVTNTTTLNGISVPDIGGTNMPYSVAHEIHGPGRSAGQINAGDTAVVMFQVLISATPPARLNNSATIYADGIDPTTAQQAAANITPVYTDLAVGLAGSPNPVAAGAPISYALSVTNFGPNSLNDITNFITLELPLSAAILSPNYTPATGAYNPLTGVWSGISLPSNGVVTMTISGVVSAAITASNIMSSVTVSPPPGLLDLVTNNNFAAATNTVVKVADLTVTLSDGVTNVLPGGVLNYTVTVINLGPSTLGTLVLSNSFSSFLSNLSFAPAQGAFNFGNGVWNGLDLVAGGSVILSVQATVLTNVSGAFTNVSRVFVPAGVTDPVLTNNTATNVNVVLTADLAIGKSGPPSVLATGSVTYTLSITNFGPFTASSVMVTDSLPASATFVSASGGGVTNASGVIWSLGNLAKSAISNLTLTVLAPASGTLTNIAQAASPVTDTNLANNTTRSVITTVTPVADLAIGKSGPAAGSLGNFNYTISVTNFGPSSAAGFNVTDSLPSGIVFVSALPATITNHVNQVIWTNSSAFASGATTSFTLTVKALSRASFTNLATVGGPTLDNMLANNTNSPVVTIITNRPPVAVNDTASTARNLAVTIPVLANDSDPDGDTLTIVFVGPTNGTAIISGTNIVYTPTNAVPGTNIFSYTISDGFGGTNSAWVTVSVTNRPPVAVNDTAKTARNVAVTIPVLANDSDPDGDALTIVSVNPTNGTAIISGTNIVYTPTNAIPGTNIFSYTISDGFGGTNFALVTVSVTNRPPVAVNDTASTARNLAVTIPVLANDSDPDGDTLTIVSVNPTNGMATISGTNVVYTPTNAVPGTNIFSYTISDGFGGTNSAWVTVAVTNRPPVAVNDTASTARNLAATIPVLANDSDPDGDVLTIVSVNPTNGMATISGTNVVYTPTNAVPGTNIFSYTISDGFGGTNSAWVTVAVTNRPPVAVNDVTNTPENIAVTVPVLANDSDPDGDALTIISVSPTNGTAIISGTNVVFTPATNFIGSATVGYQIRDNFGGTNGALITIGVTNAPPVANPDSFAITENTTNFFAVLGNDVVVTPGGTLTLVSVSTTNGVAVTNGPNITFIPAANFLGMLTLNYTISDNVGGTNSSTVTVLVTNIPPVANPDVYTILENSTNTLAPLSNDLVQTPGGSLSLVSVIATNGSATILNGTNVVFTPTNNFTGTATIGYVITDGIGGTNSSVIAVTVLSVADLGVSKSGPANVYAATNFSYTITVTNFGPGAAASLSVTDNLPSAVVLAMTPPGTVVNGSQVVWTNLGSLAASAATNLTVTVTAPLTALSLTNIASAGSPTSDPNPTNNTSPPVVTLVAPVADMMIAKAGPPFVLATGIVNYTISVTNLGPSSASSVVVTDTLPMGVFFVNASGGGSTNSGSVNWNLGTLTAGQSSNLTLTVTAPASGTLTNIANVVSPTVDTNLLNNSTPPVVTTVTLQADLAVGKSAPATVLAVSNLIYTITVTNLGPSTASSVVLTDSLPAGVSFASASGGGADNSDVITWNLGDLANGAISNVTLTVLAPASGSITNVATVGSPNIDPNPTNNTSPPVVTTVIPLADLAIAKTGPANVSVASNFSYTISVTNLGPSSASGVVVTDTLPAGVVFVSASDGGTNNSGAVSWSLGTLAASQSTNLTVTVTAPASAGTLTNVASVTAPTGDTNILNNLTPPVITMVTPVADVSVVKTGPAGVTFGTNFSYAIAVSNAGPSTAASVIVTDSLPVGLVFIGAVPAATTNAGSQVIWNLGDFAAGTGSNLTLTVISTQLGSLTNLASGGSPTPDPVPTNNSAPPVVTMVTNIPPLAIPDSYTVAENTTNTFNPLVNDVLQTPGGNLAVINVYPTNGIAAIVNNTNVIFTPTNNFLGVTVIGYTITDNVGGTNNSFITVLVTNVPPVANPDSFAITENTTNFFAVLGNDVVVTPGGTLMLVSVSTTNGTATTNGANVVFTPATNFLGTLTLNYTISDNVGGTSGSYVTVLVTNLPPMANPDAYGMAENTTNTFSPLVNDVVETPGGVLQIIGVSPTNGTASILDLTNVVFTPANNFVGMATIGYTITDGLGGTNSTVITVTVTNLVPIAFGQSLATTENTGLPVTLTGSDPAARPLTFILVSGPTGGVLTGLNTNTGAGTYTPTNNFTGTDTFTFRVNDGFDNSSNATISIAVTPVADVLVAQSGPAAGVAGANLVFTVGVTNLGPAAATNLVVTNQLDAGFTFVGASASGVTNGNHQVIWTVPVLPASTATNFTVTLSAVEGGTFTNVASGISLTPDLDATNNNGSLTNAQVVTVISALADMAVFKTGTAAVVAGGSVNYTITATNFGPSTASNVVVRDTLPAGATAPLASGSYSVSNGVIIWAAAVLPGGTAVNFTVTLTAPNSGTLTNIASSTSDTADPNSGNNDGSSPSSVVITPVTLVADLAIGKSAAASVPATSNLVYTISVTNFGPSIASSVTVTDAVPANTSFVGASGGGAANAGVVTWRLGSLSVGVVSNVTLTVAAPASGMLTNVASVGSPTSDPDLTNNLTPPVVTTVTPVADVAVGKRGPAGSTFNTSFNYTISVTNFGPSTASGILVTDSLPVGLIFVSAMPSTTTNTSGQVIWGPVNLVAGTTTNLTLTVMSTALGAVTNLASVGAPPADPSLTNNVSQPVITLVTNIPPQANPDSYTIGENSGTNTFSPLANDVVLNPGGILQLLAVNATNGAALISGNSVLFVPGTNYVGLLTIGYTITDNVGGTNSSFITVLVTNVPPQANPDLYTVAENSGQTTLSPLVNDLVQTPGGMLSLIHVSPTNGTATISGTNVLFTPTANFFGVATIGYTITDSIGGTNSSLITVNVTNVPPLANGQSTNTAENTALHITLTGSDPNPLPLTFAIVGNPPNGVLSSLNASTGTVTYTPATNYTGSDSFTFRVNNGQTNSAPATVSISIALAADLAVSQAGPASGFAGSNLVFTVSVTNRGPAAATSVVVSNQLAPGFTFVNASGGGANSGNLVVWNFAALAPNSATNFTVTAYSLEGGSFTNIASGASAVLDLNPTNNNGTLLNAKSVTVLTPVVDLVVYKDGGTNVLAGTLVNYTITASNAGPSTATSTVIQDTLPAGAAFQSATGTYSVSNGVVTWSGLTLAPGAVTTFNLTLLASGSVSSFVNIASGTSAGYDPDPTNNNGSYAKSRVTTKVTPSADVIAAITGPASAILGSNITFAVFITNAGPSTASNVVAADVLPPNLVFISASAGGTNSNGTNASGTITWPPILALGAGGSTNFTFTAKSLVAGLFTNVVSSTSITFDPNPTNNTGVLPTAQAQTQVSVPQFSLVSGAPVFNPQTGLYEEQVVVTNTGATTLPGIQLYVGGLRSGVSLYNAAGTNGGVPYVQYGFPLDPGNNVNFTLEFYNPSRQAFSNTLYVLAYMPSNTVITNPSNSVPVTTVFTDTRTTPPRFVIEWASVPGKTYIVIYASTINATTWLVATPSITATANITQWYDDGPPKTASAPLTSGDRFYRIIQY